MIRVAFAPPHPQRWTGGYQYYLNLFRVLHRYGRGMVRPVVFVPGDAGADVLAPYTEGLADLVRAELFALEQGRGRLVDAVFRGRDRRAEALYREHGIQVAFEAATYHGIRFPVPTIAWLPDFQHRRLPHMFSRRAWWQREIGTQAQIRSARAVMVSSEIARIDCEELYPAALGRIHVVPFAIELTAEAFAVEPDEARVRYQLPEHFFYLPNQFWKHKNHATVIQALALLRDRRVGVVVAASGTQADPRHPHLMDELRASVARLGLEEQFRFLGMVSRPDVYALMRAALAVLNPSAFEGWSTTVEEAKALAVPLVLSAIPVHREQVGEAAVYFDQESPDALAGALEHALHAGPATGTPVRCAETEQRNRARLADYALRFEQLIDTVART